MGTVHLSRRKGEFFANRRLSGNIPLWQENQLFGGDRLVPHRRQFSLKIRSTLPVCGGAE
jgi:hypothetical protein